MCYNIIFFILLLKRLPITETSKATMLTYLKCLKHWFFIPVNIFRIPWIDFLINFHSRLNWNIHSEWLSYISSNIEMICKLKKEIANVFLKTMIKSDLTDEDGFFVGM